jgi:hypothetical protein
VIERQQAELVEMLRRAEGRPVSFARLRGRGVEFPASVAAELELAGVPVERCTTDAGAGRGEPALRLHPAYELLARASAESAARDAQTEVFGLLAPEPDAAEAATEAMPAVHRRATPAAAAARARLRAALAALAAMLAAIAAKVRLQGERARPAAMSAWSRLWPALLRAAALALAVGLAIAAGMRALAEHARPAAASALARLRSALGFATAIALLLAAAERRRLAAVPWRAVAHERARLARERWAAAMDDSRELASAGWRELASLRWRDVREPHRRGLALRRLRERATPGWWTVRRARGSARAPSQQLQRRRRQALVALAAAAVAVLVLALLTLGSGARGARGPGAAPHRSARSPSSSAQTAPPASGPQAAAQSVPRSPAAAAALEAQGHELLEAGAYAGAARVLANAVAATGERPAACLEPSEERCLTYAYALYDLGRALALSGHAAAAVPVLRERLQIDNQRPTVQAELLRASAQAGLPTSG